MPPPAPARVDPVFAEIAKAIYGDDVDVRELAKFSPGSSDVHVDGPMTEAQAKKQKRVAQTGMAATGVAAAGGLHAVSASVKEHKNRMREAKGLPAKVETRTPLGVKFARKTGIKPSRVAAAVGGGYFALHGVELAADGLAAHAQAKQIRQANASIKEPVAKAFRLKPLNVLPNRVPSLRAKRPKLTPQPANPTTKAGLYQPLGKSGLTDVTWTGVIAKVDADKRQVFGWASVSAINGEEVVDLQGDIVPIEEIEKSAYRYVIESRRGGDMHQRVGKAGFNLSTDQPLHTADMIESFVVTPEKLEKMGLPANSLPHGWWVGYHVNDDAQWAMVKSGERQGFSIHGKGSRAPISKRVPIGIPIKKLPKKATLRPLDAAKSKVVGALHRHAPMIDTAARAVSQPKGYGQLLAKADGSGRAKAAGRVKLKERAEQAIHPPAVQRRSVKSMAIDSMGYQRQTRRLAVVMHTRPDRPYEYRMKPNEAEAALNAPSLGRHYATKVARKVKRANGYTPADRARLFLDPQKEGVNA